MSRDTRHPNKDQLKINACQLLAGGDSPLLASSNGSLLAGNDDPLLAGSNGPLLSGYDGPLLEGRQ